MVINKKMFISQSEKRFKLVLFLKSSTQFFHYRGVALYVVVGRRFYTSVPDSPRWGSVTHRPSFGVNRLFSSFSNLKEKFFFLHQLWYSAALPVRSAQCVRCVVSWITIYNQLCVIGVGRTILLLWIHPRSLNCGRSFSLPTILQHPEIIFMENWNSKVIFIWYIFIVFDIPVIEKLNNSVK